MKVFKSILGLRYDPAGLDPTGLQQSFNDSCDIKILWKSAAVLIWNLIVEDYCVAYENREAYGEFGCLPSLGKQEKKVLFFSIEKTVFASVCVSVTIAWRPISADN